MKAALTVLREGELTLMGLLPWSSNYTFLGQVTSDDERVSVVDKPLRGERFLTLTT